MHELNPWWYLSWVAVLAGVGYFTDGRLGVIEGTLAATVLAHAATIEILRKKFKQ